MVVGFNQGAVFYGALWPPDPSSRSRTLIRVRNDERGEAGLAGPLLAGWWKPRITRPIPNRPEAPPPVITRFRRVIHSED
jgi:hypothetical protein